MSLSRVYLDYNATTPVSAEVRARLPEALDLWGNPSSIHWAGRGPKSVLRETRQTLSQALNVHPLEIVFTSGGSESNNAVLKGAFQTQLALGRNEILVSAVEHPSVLKTIAYLKENHAAVVHILPVDREGQIDLRMYKEKLSSKTALVSVMMANNETGVIFPISEMVTEAHKHGALFHSDMVQALGKIPLDLKAVNVDFASFSAHKFYSLKGCGFLYAKKSSEWMPLIHGGGHERHRRGGTENTLGIFALGVQAQQLHQVPTQRERLTKLRDQMEADILRMIPEVTITHGKAQRLANTSSLILKGVDGETLLMSLDLKGFAVSTGAACSSGSPEPSPVLLAIGLSRAEAQNSLRVSLGWSTTEEEVKAFVQTLCDTVDRLRKISEEDIVEKRQA